MNVKTKNIQIENSVKTLQTSPLFQLSLGSKELFHSNFLAWLFEMYPQESGRVISRFLKKTTGDVEVNKVLRELKNRDLTIYFNNGQELVIENKVKSLPYIEQLELYSKDAEAHQNFVLLSLMRPPFSIDGTIKIGSVVWNVLTYSHLAVLIKEIGTSIQNEYHRSILSDYESFIISFSEIFVSNTYGDGDLFSDFYDPSKGSVFQMLQPLRIGDIYQKLRYEAFAGRIYEILTKKYPDLVYLSESDEGRKVGSIYVSHGMSRALGMVSVSYVLAKGLYLTVQIQGGSYRQMVQGYSGYGKTSRKVAERLKVERLWFDFDHIGASEEYPRADKGFNEYSGIDFYRSVKLPSIVTVEQVLGFVVRDIERIMQSKDSLLI